MGVVKIKDLGLTDEEIERIKWIAKEFNCQEMRFLDEPLKYEDIKIKVDKSRL